MRSVWTKHWKTQKTLSSTSYGGNIWQPSLISCHVVSHSGWQPLPEIIKMAAKALSLQWKSNIHKFGSIFNFNMWPVIFTILDDATKNHKDAFGWKGCVFRTRNVTKYMLYIFPTSQRNLGMVTFFLQAGKRYSTQKTKIRLKQVKQYLFCSMEWYWYSLFYHWPAVHKESSTCSVVWSGTDTHYFTIDQQHIREAILVL